jgi:hypothetical protein
MLKNKTKLSGLSRSTAGKRQSRAVRIAQSRGLNRLHRMLGFAGRIGHISEEIHLIYWNWRTGQYAKTSKPLKPKSFGLPLNRNGKKQK